MSFYEQISLDICPLSDIMIKKTDRKQSGRPFLLTTSFLKFILWRDRKICIKPPSIICKPCPCFALLALSYLLRIAMASITSHPQGLELEGTGSNLGLVLSWACSPHGSHSVQFSCSVMSDSLWPHEPQHTRPPCPSPTPRVDPNSCPLSWWCHLIISSSLVPFSSCPQSSPASASFQMSQFFTSGGQNIGVSASTSVSTGQISTLVSWYHGDFLHTATIPEISQHHPGFHPRHQVQSQNIPPLQSLDYLLIHPYRDITEFLPLPSPQVHAHFKLFMSKI